MQRTKQTCTHTLMSKSKDIKKDYSGSIFIRDETQKYKKVSIGIHTFFHDEK